MPLKHRIVRGAREGSGDGEKERPRPFRERSSNV